MKIGNITKLPLAHIFKHEAHDFTPWLQNNLSLLSDAVGFNITQPEAEHRLENFIVDVVAQVGDNENDRVIIENEYGTSNHDHLGKLITYAATIGARVAVWIVEEARVEHINAVNKLNECRCADCGFFLVEAQALQINDSPAAILFNVIVKPQFDIINKELSTTSETLRGFWQMFANKAKEISFKPFAGRATDSMHWMNGKMVKGKARLCVSIGKDYHTIKFIFDGKDKEENEKCYNLFFEHQDEIDKKFGECLDWREMPGNKTSMISKTYADGGYAAPLDEWNGIMDNMLSRLMSLEKAVSLFYCLL